MICLTIPFNSYTLGNIISSSVCAIAGTHYQYMRLSKSKNEEIVSTRYSDWYITTILMLVEFFNLSGTLISRWQWLLGCCIMCELMLLCGHISTIQMENKSDYYIPVFILGCIFGSIMALFFFIGTLLQTNL